MPSLCGLQLLRAVLAEALPLFLHLAQAVVAYRLLAFRAEILGIPGLVLGAFAGLYLGLDLRRIHDGLFPYWFGTWRLCRLRRHYPSGFRPRDCTLRPTLACNHCLLKVLLIFSYKLKFIRIKTDAIAVFQQDLFVGDKRLPVEERLIAALQIAEIKVPIVEADLCVVPRHRIKGDRDIILLVAAYFGHGLELICGFLGVRAQVI